MPESGIYVDLRTRGFNELAEELKNLKKGVIMRVLKRGVQNGMKPMRKIGLARYASVARVRTGALRQSLGTKRIRRPKGSRVWYQIYKPRAGFKTRKGVEKAASNIKVPKRKDGKYIGRVPGKVHDNIVPYKYAYLVEYGTKRSRAFPYMRKAIDTALPQIERYMAKGFEDRLDIEWKKIDSRVRASKKP